MITPSTIDPIKLPGKPALPVDADGSATIEATADYFEMDVRKLRGLIHSNASIHHPIGSLALGICYPWSVQRWMKWQEKLAAAKPPPSLNKEERT